MRWQGSTSTPRAWSSKSSKRAFRTAVRGHKLLKDKSDEMIRRFTVMARENLALRREVEGELARILGQFQVARSVTPAYRAETAFALPASSVRAECSVTSVMGLDVPRIALSQSGGRGASLCLFRDHERGGLFGEHGHGALSQTSAARGSGKVGAHARRTRSNATSGASTRSNTS